MLNTACMTCGLTAELEAVSAEPGVCPACESTLAESATGLTLLAPGESGALNRVSSIEFSPKFRERYRPECVLGRGAAGTVLRCADLQLGRTVAVKFLTASGSSSSLMRFQRECELLAALQHPNVPRLFDAGEQSGHPYMVTEYLEGGTLASMLRKEPQPPVAQVVKIIAECLEALAACHEKGIVHRDFKPANVIFGADGRARVADLGIAKWQSATGALTQAGALLGTPRYMAPEQIRGEAAVPATDLYSVGAVLYEMLAGGPVFGKVDYPALMRLHAHGVPEPLQKLVPGLPKELCELVHASLAKRPEERPASALEFAAALRRAGTRPRTTGRLQASRPEGALARGSGPSAASAAQGRGPRLALALAALAVCGLVAWGVTRKIRSVDRPGTDGPSPTGSPRPKPVPEATAAGIGEELTFPASVDDATLKAWAQKWSRTFSIVHDAAYNTGADPEPVRLQARRCLSFLANVPGGRGLAHVTPAIAEIAIANLVARTGALTPAGFEAVALEGREARQAVARDLDRLVSEITTVGEAVIGAPQAVSAQYEMAFLLGRSQRPQHQLIESRALQRLLSRIRAWKLSLPDRQWMFSWMTAYMHHDISDHRLELDAALAGLHQFEAIYLTRPVPDDELDTLRVWYRMQNRIVLPCVEAHEERQITGMERSRRAMEARLGPIPTSLKPMQAALDAEVRGALAPKQ